MSVSDVLKATIDVLNGIEIPACLSEKIGIPIMRCANNLQICIDAINTLKEEQMDPENVQESEEKENEREIDPE